MNRAAKSAFTLIELMIVIAVIAIVLAIAIPSLMSSRKSANETSAIASLRTLASANNQYKTRFKSYSNSLNNLRASGFIDTVLASGTKSGYRFTYSGNANTWSTRANPTQTGTTGNRGFFIDDRGVIRFVASGNATSTSAPIN